MDYLRRSAKISRRDRIESTEASRQAYEQKTYNHGKHLIGIWTRQQDGNRLPKTTMNWTPPDRKRRRWARNTWKMRETRAMSEGTWIRATGLIERHGDWQPKDDIMFKQKIYTHVLKKMLIYILFECLINYFPFYLILFIFTFLSCTLISWSLIKNVIKRMYFFVQRTRLSLKDFNSHKEYR